MDDRLNDLHLQQKLQESRIQMMEKAYEEQRAKEEQFHAEMYRELTSLREDYQTEIKELKNLVDKFIKTFDKWLQRIFGGVIATVFLYLLMKYGLDEVIKQFISRLL